MDTHVTSVLDSSGSMSAIRDDTVGGFNTFLADLREEEGYATVSLYDFNTTVNRVYVGRDLDEAPELGENYTPGGRTALHDAIVTAIDETVEFLETQPEDPENVILVVLTDGKENASETPPDTVRERVEATQDADWEVLFIGANQDAALTAGSMGLDQKQAMNMPHSDEGVKSAFASSSQSVNRTRRTGKSDGFSDEDRKSD